MSATGVSSTCPATVRTIAAGRYEDARDKAVATGIVINGLPILNDRPQPFQLPTPMEVALDTYYAESVIGGPGSFVQTAMDFTDFRIAILNKLIREIAGNETPVRAAQR